MLPPIVHHPDYDAKFPPDHRFPMSKYKFLMAAITRRGLVGRDNLFVPAPANASWLKLAHCSSYVDQVVNSTVPYRIEREIGFPVDERVSRRARLAVSGTVLAARLALDRGIACNAAGGSHHARHDQGAGFCTFNDVAVAANVLLADGSVDRIAVIDLDVHQGDGTAQIFSGDDRVYSFSMHAERNYPVRKAKSDLDIALPDGTNDEGYLSALEYALPEVLKSGKPDIVFYNAGVDPHCEDRLGRLALTDDGLRRRDRAVVGFFRSRGIPVCGVIGGGYSMDIEALAARHAILFETVAELMST
jgi:acetoin utilization deacetylase AcuC-like enzyme